jgi:predicted alpha/beta-hydrolase family hydrolase
MWTTASWSIEGFGRLAVPNAFYEKSTANIRLGVVFPGYGYTVDAPLLFYTNALLSQLGYDVLNLNYEYNRNQAYQKSSDSEREAWFREDISGVVSSLASHTQYSEWVFIGKSLGTTAMLQVLESHRFDKKARSVWLTPAGALPHITDFLSKERIVSLFLVGTEDRFYDAAEYAKLQSLPHVHVEAISAADHCLDLKDDVLGSLRILQEAIESIRSFLSVGGLSERTGA